MKVVKLKYQNEEIPIKLSFYALKHFQAETKKDILQLSENEDLSLEQYELLFYLAYEAGCRALNIEKKYERKDMEFILDDCYMDFIAVIPEFFPDPTQKKIVKKANSRK